jgi:hypothetical protein
MLRSRLPPEVRYGTAYLVPDLVTDCEPQILPALLLGLLTAAHCEIFKSPYKLSDVVISSTK